jgi:hypothetical protein
MIVISWRVLGPSLSRSVLELRNTRNLRAGNDSLSDTFTQFMPNMTILSKISFSILSFFLFSLSLN